MIGSIRVQFSGRSVLRRRNGLGNNWALSEGGATSETAEFLGRSSLWKVLSLPQPRQDAQIFFLGPKWAYPYAEFVICLKDSWPHMPRDLINVKIWLLRLCSSLFQENKWGSKWHALTRAGPTRQLKRAPHTAGSKETANPGAWETSSGTHTALL